MAVARPYRKTCRQFLDGSYPDGGRWQYLLQQKFVKDPQHYVRAFLKTGLPHIYNHDVLEEEVEEMLRSPGEDRPGDAKLITESTRALRGSVGGAATRARRYVEHIVTI